jgi:hypothetical protein
MAPNTTTAMPTQIQNTNMCRPYILCASSVTPVGRLYPFEVLGLSANAPDANPNAVRHNAAVLVTLI